MVLYNLGSVVTDVSNYIGPTNIPSNLSGTNMNNVVTQEINFINTLTNANIGTTDIAVTYQPALIDLVLSKILISIEANQGGIDSVSLGELAISQGASSNSELAKQLRDDAIQRLRELGRYIRYGRFIGG